MRPSLSIVFLLAFPAAAIADVDVHVDVGVDVHVPTPETVESPPPPPPIVSILGGSHWEFGASLEGGQITLGDVSGEQFGVRAELGRQLGPVRLSAEYSLAKFAATRDLYDEMGWWSGWEDVGGETSRAGLAARFRWIHQHEPDFFSPYRADLGFYFEAGVGTQHVVLGDGREFDRDDFMLGTGIEVGGGRSRIGIFDLGVRAMIADSLEPGMHTHDIGILASIGGKFGL